MSTCRGRRRVIEPSVVVLTALLSSFGWVLLFPVRLTEPPPGAPAVVFRVTLAAFAVLLGLLLRAAVTPSGGTRRAIWSGALLLVVLGLWLPAYAWARPGDEPWAWMAGFVIGACALATPRLAVVAGLGLVLASVAGAVAFDGSVVANMAYTLGAGLVSWLTGWVLVWLLRLVWAAEAGRDAEAHLAVMSERLRMSRELHDVLGHRLSVIAVKAELAADLAADDPERAAQESRSVREMAAATLAEARRAVQAEVVADLATQLASAELVLESAGVQTTIAVDAAQVPARYRALAATVVREAVTNILRHSDARAASFTFPGAGLCPTLVIVNDGVPAPPGPPPAEGTGLAGLAGRSAAVGARLSAYANARGTFEVRLELGSPPTRS